MNNKLKIVEKSIVFFIISAAIIVAGIILLIVPGLHLGLDFTEGASVQVHLNVASSDKDSGYVTTIENYIEDNGFEVGNTRITSDNRNSVLQFDLRYRYNNAKVANDEFADLLGDEESGLIGDIIKYML